MPIQNIKFDQFTNYIQKQIYQKLWGDFDFSNKKFTKTLGPRGLSNNSYSFYGADKQQVLIENFQLKNENLFRKKYQMAVGGSGQEEKRITTFHSSALCALLFFYNITETNPWEVEIEGQKQIFTKSIFEYKNQVIKNPSNIDLVLINDKEDTLLFLESKFSEYIKPVKTINIKPIYLENQYSKDIYGDKNLLKSLGVSLVKTKEMIQLHTREDYYLEGIKQMISHYVGIRNLMEGRVVEKGPDKKIVEQVVENSGKIYLGHVLFDYKIAEIENKGRKINYKEAYADKYKILAAILNCEIEKAGLKNYFRVLEETFSYTEIKNKVQIEDAIKNFYFS